MLTFLSYRDPNLLNTLDAYDQTAEVLRSGSLTEDELVKNIIGAIGSLDAYQLPDAKGFTSLVQTLLGETDEKRQQYRDDVLRTSMGDLEAFANVLDEVAAHGRVAILGGEEAIRGAEEVIPLQRVWRVM